MMTALRWKSIYDKITKKPGINFKFDSISWRCNMKIMICGKGGCGKSTITALLAKALKTQGRTVLVVDADESNLCLHRLLGLPLPEILMDAMGGRQGTREKLKKGDEHSHGDDFFGNFKKIEDLPANCVTADGNLKLLVVGKIKQYGEGCACMIGGVSKAVLSHLQEASDEIILIDAEAGLEHFGRRIDANCDLILTIIEPSFESIQMAERACQIAQEAGVQAYYILNKVAEEFRAEMTANLDMNRVVATLPRSEELFLTNLQGGPIQSEFPEVKTICEFIDNYRKPVSLAVTF